MSWYARSRQRSDRAVHQVTCHHVPPFGQPYVRVREYPSLRRAEFMLDINRDEFRHKEGYYPVQPVTHFQASVKHRRQAVPWTWGGDTCTPVGGMVMPIDAHHFEELIYPLDLGRSAWESFARDAVDAFYDQMPDEVSLPNFVWEAKEWRSLFTSFIELAKKRSMKGLTKSVSGSFLSWEFGWKPMLDDIRKMGSIATVVEMKLQQLRETWGRRTRLAHFSRHKEELDIYQDYAWTGLHGFQTRVRLVSLEREMRTGGYLYHKLDGLDDALAMTKGMLAACGFFNPAKVWWESIRYSFVIDWFTKFGSLLDRLEIQPFSGLWDVSDVTYSVKDTWKLEIDQLCDGQVLQKACSTVTLRTYQRRVGIPVPAIVFADLGSLNQKQQVLLLALLDQIR